MMVPRIIPKRRVLIIGITLVFCSAIFMTSLSIFDSITSLNSNLYGTGDDIVIIFDTEAQTPFTSSVPQSLNNALKQHEGVIETSGEILIPVIVKNEPVFVRGVIYQDLSNIYLTTIRQGTAFNESDRGLIMVGDKIAQRMNIGIGDYLRIASTIRNQEMRAVVGGIFHSEQDELNDEILTSISFAQGLTSKQNEFTHIIVKIDPSITNSEEIFDFVSTIHKVTIRVFSDNGTRQVSRWKLTVFDSQDEKIHSKYENGEAEVFLQFGEYSFQATDGIKSAYVSKRDIIENTSFNMQLDALIYNIDIFAHNNGTPADNQFYELLDERRQIKASGNTDIDGKSRFIVKSGDYSLRFWQESVVTDFKLKVSGPMNETFNLSKLVIPHVTFNGFNNGSIIINNEGHLSITELMIDPVIKIDNIEVQPLMNRIYYNLTDGNHNLTVLRSSEVLTTFFFTVDSNFSAFNPINITNYAEISSESLLNFSLIGVNYDNLINIFVNNLEYDNFVSIDNILQLKLNDNYIGPINITLAGYTVGNQEISKQFIYYVTENPNPAGIVGEREHIYLRQNDIITLWHTYYNITVSVLEQELEVINNRVQIPNLSLGNHALNLTSEYGEPFLREITIVSNYSHLIKIINGTTVNSLDESITFQEDNLIIDFDHYLFAIRAFSNKYSIQIFPNNSFPTILNNESILNFEITSLLTNLTESVNLINSAPGLELLLPVIKDFRKDVLVDGKLYSLSPIEEYLEWTFNFLNSSIEYNSIPQAIYLANTQQFILAPGFWEITALNNQTNVTWTSYIPVWNKIYEINGTANIQVDGYNFTAENMTLHLLDSRAYVINDQYYYYETFNNETLEYSRHFSGNKIMIGLPEWVVFAEYTTYIENTITPHNYLGTSFFEIPTETNITQNFTIEFEITDYYGYSTLYNQTYIYNIPIVSTIININDEINISTSYDLILRNWNTAEIFTFHLNTNQLQLDLMKGNWSIEVISLDIHFRFIKPVESIINLNLALYNITVSSNNFNFDELRHYEGILLVKNLHSGDSFYYRHDNANNLRLINSIYIFTIFSDRALGSKTIIVDSNHPQVTVDYDFINETGYIRLIGGQGIDAETATIRHISTNIVKFLIQSEDSWLVDDFPIGNVYVTVTQGGIKTVIFGWYEPSFRNLILYMENSTITIDTWDGKGGVIQANNAHSLDAVSGPLAYTQVIITAEKLIIFLSLIVNISGVYSGLISESRNEIKIARSIGFSKLQVLIGILRDLWYIGVLTTVIGGFIGIAITSILFNSDTTILFGHRFVPEFPLLLWIVNFISVNIIAVAGGIIGLKLEADFS